MAGAKDGIEYLIEAKVNDAIKNLKKFDDKTKKSQSKTSSGLSMMKVGWLALAGVMSGVVGVAFKKTIGLASDFNEANQKFDVTFKGVGKGADKMRKSLVKSYGLSSLAATELLANTGDMLSGFGMNAEQALKTSGAVNKLAADLSSFANIPIEQASKALTSGLMGEREAMKSLGISIQEADVKQALFATGKDKLTGIALKQARAEVTLQLALSQSKNAIGDFQRSSDSFANTTKVLGARWEDFQVVVGQKFLPLLKPLASGLGKLLTPQDSLAESTAKLITLNKRLTEIQLKRKEGVEDLTKEQKKQLDLEESLITLDIKNTLSQMSERYKKLTESTTFTVSGLEKANRTVRKNQLLYDKLSGSIIKAQKAEKDKVNVQGMGILSMSKARSMLTKYGNALKDSKEAEKLVTDEIKNGISSTTRAYINKKITIEDLYTVEEKYRQAILDNVEAEKLLMKTEEDAKNKPKPKPKDEKPSGGLTKPDKSKADSAKELAELEKKLAQEKIDREQATAKAVIDVTRATFDTIQGLANAGLDAQLARLDAEMSADIANIGASKELRAIADEEEAEHMAGLEAERDKALERGDARTAKEKQREIDKINLAKEMEAERIKIEEDGERKKKALKKKQAISDKVFSIFQAGLAMAQAIASVFANQPGGVATKSIASGIAAGIAGANLAAVIATPIPAFKDGTPDGGFITNGEQLIRVGDNASGRERVDVTPLDSGDSTGSASGNTYIFNGIEDLSGARNELMQLEGADAWQ